MRSNSIDCYHVVTAAEAAYTSLIGHLYESGEEWVADQFPLHSRTWPITLRAAYVDASRAGVHIHGVHLQLYAMATNTRPVALCSGVQGYVRRVGWFGELPTRYGLGFLARLGALQADDVLQIGVIYEYV